MDTVQFTNNLGALQLQYALLTLADSWAWRGSMVHTKTINVSQAYVTRADPGFEGLLVNPDGDRGDRGTLTLPWTTIDDVRIESFNRGGDGLWADWVPVQISFLDNHPDQHLYTVHFFDLELNNPRLMLGLPFRPIQDDHPQMPVIATGVIDYTNLRFGAMRTRQPYGPMSLTLSGAMPVEQATLPEHLVDILSQRVGGRIALTNLAGMPAGYPNIFKLSDAVPELNLPLTTVFVARSRVVWQVEAGVAQIEVTMNCQPQTVTGS